MRKIQHHYFRFRYTVAGRGDSIPEPSKCRMGVEERSRVGAKQHHQLQREGWNGMLYPIYSFNPHLTTLLGYDLEQVLAFFWTCFFFVTSDIFSVECLCLMWMCQPQRKCFATSKDSFLSSENPIPCSAGSEAGSPREGRILNTLTQDSAPSYLTSGKSLSSLITLSSFS